MIQYSVSVKLPDSSFEAQQKQLVHGASGGPMAKQRKAVESCCGGFESFEAFEGFKGCWKRAR